MFMTNLLNILTLARVIISKNEAQGPIMETVL